MINRNHLNMARHTGPQAIGNKISTLPFQPLAAALALFLSFFCHIFCELCLTHDICIQDRYHEPKDKQTKWK